MRNVALLLRKGEGTTRDPKRALWFYEEAGAKGFSLAQVNAAFMHLEGDGVPKNLEAAAMRNVALLLRKGEGTPRDPKRALWFYEEAGAMGDRTSTSLNPSH